MIVDEKYAGKRLDFALQEHAFCTNQGLRARKRLCEQGFVQVNKKVQKAHYKLKLGECIEVLAKKEEQYCFKLVKDEMPENLQKLIRAEQDDFLVLYKEKGLASAKIENSFLPSLEEEMQKYNDFILVNRLDTQTSGLLVFAKGKKAESLWKKAQEEGKIKKYYLALVEEDFTYTQEKAQEYHKQCLDLFQGLCSRDFQKIEIDFKIDLSKTKVKALESIDEQKNRHTQIIFSDQKNKEESIFKELEKSSVQKYQDLKEQIERKKIFFVRCRIQQGVRHQVRCHLASIGFPLVGDSLYNSKFYEHEDFFLCHYAIKSPFFNCSLDI